MIMMRLKKSMMIMLAAGGLALLALAPYSRAQDGGSDAIAVRIIPNPNHYSISRWYSAQGFTGSPQALIVDGYEAIRDGRTVYVNAANIDPAGKMIYTNIYLISYNQDPAPNTTDILGQIISHWKFNDNITGNIFPLPSCSISSLNCASDSDCGQGQTCASAGPSAGSCVLTATKNCLTDSECPAHFFCDSLKAKVTRDIKRVGRLEELREALANFKRTNSRYPSLAAGTYIPSNSLSVWPSWNQSLLSALAVGQSLTDPINKIGNCRVDAAVKNGSAFSVTVNDQGDGGTSAHALAPARWDYNFTVNEGEHRLWLETTNDSPGRGDHPDLSVYDGANEQFCSERGLQHHLVISVDGVQKGALCAPAVPPTAPRQTSYMDLGSLTAGTHVIRVEWDNNWGTPPDDSNILIYRLGLTPSDTFNFDRKTCWDENQKKFFSYEPASGRLTLPAASYVFAYASDANGSKYDICATLESRDASPAYNFYPFDLTDSACVSAAGVMVGGEAGNSAPRIISQSLTGEANQPFNGFIQVVDSEGNPLKWTIVNQSPAFWGTWNAGSNRPPVLQDTSNPNQKKIYAATAGQPGTYNLSLLIDDGQGGTLSATVPIVISSSAITLDAENVEYVLDPEVPFVYKLYFYSNNLSNPSTSYSVTRVSGPAGALAGLTPGFADLGGGKYEVSLRGQISMSNVFTQDTTLVYHLTVTDRYGKSAGKDFNIKLKVTPPRLDFNCAVTARVGQTYRCELGGREQGGHSITYSVTGLPDNLDLIVPTVVAGERRSGGFLAGALTSLRDWIWEKAIAAGGDLFVISGQPRLSMVGSHAITVTAVNEYGTRSQKSFNLSVNSFCGDNTKQSPNSEGRGGLYNDGREDCDGAAGTTNTPADSNINLQYGCTSGGSTPNPILTNDQCIFKSPLQGGGYCGDGYCQLKIDGQSRESCWKCAEDCGECAATVTAVTKEESVVYFNGRREYRATWPNQGSVTKNLLAGKNVFAFWSHVASGPSGLAYRIVVGPVDDPYDVLDTTNSRLSCAADASPGPFLESSNYDPSAEKTNGGYNWPENNFVESGFSLAKVIIPAANAGLVSPLAQVNIAGKTVNDPFLPYAWGQVPAASPSAFYCRLTYNYSLANLGICRPRCADRDCGTDGCGGSCGDRTDNAACAAATKVCSAATNNQCCVPQCNGKCAGESDGCGGACGLVTIGGKPNNACASSGEERSCNAVLGVTGGFIGNARCNSTCTAFDTSLQYCQIDPAGWYQAPSESETYLDRPCLIKMNIDSAYNIDCSDRPSATSLSPLDPSDAANTKSQWFLGRIAKPDTKICSVTGCILAVNPNKCRYYTTYGAADANCLATHSADYCNTGIWSGLCYVKCEARCDGRQCGDDGCGNSCGSCTGGQRCSDVGQCIAPACVGDWACDDGNVCTTDTCTNPDQWNAVCTHSNNSVWEGCTRNFGTCAVSATQTCSGGVMGACASVDPRPANCNGKCGGIQSDGCGGVCSGACPSGQTCDAGGNCGGACVPNCSGKVCGGDGCGGNCGSCSARYRCAAGGTRCEFCNRVGCGDTNN